MRLYRVSSIPRSSFTIRVRPYIPAAICTVRSRSSSVVIIHGSMLAHSTQRTDEILPFLPPTIRTFLETWYTRGDLRAATFLIAHPTAPISKLQREGTRMTRIPLNRAYENSQDIREKLEMSTAEIGLAVRTTNCLEE